MKKVGVFVVLLLVLSLFSFSIALAADNETNSTTNTTDTTTTSSTSTQSTAEGIDAGFECLEEEVEGSCSDLSVQEISLTILATPKDSVLDECVQALKDKETNNHWANVKETAFAILALEHAGEDTDEEVKWILTQNRTPTDLIWYLQQDSNEATECKFSYSGNDYTINVGENKKLDADAGACLERAQSNFWLEISPDCYNQEFAVSCNKDFIANLLYRNKQSSTIYVLDETASEPAFGTAKLSVNSQCFSSGSTGCDYESTAWATLALLETGNDIEAFIPYVLAMADSNERYLPTSFSYIVTEYDDYSTQLIKEQKLGNYWEAPSTAYTRFYDTSLALLALDGSSSEQVTKAKDWLLFSQNSDGCWNNKNIRDTAIVLWALATRSGRGSGGGGVTRCADAGFFCIPRTDCPSNEVLGNYFCSGLSSVCCENENLLSCEEYTGQICGEDEICVGDARKSTDSNSCCLGTCEEAQQLSECEDIGYICRSSCADNQESIDYSCDGQGICCRTKTSPEGSSWWIWLLIILIIITLGVLAWVFRDKLKLWYFRIKSKFKKDKGKGKGGPGPQGPRGPPGFPPRPGFPPLRRPMPPRPQGRPPTRHDRRLDDTFKKLKDMSK